MKFISWNVNGLRACVGKDFEEYFNNLDADFFCLQETKDAGWTARLTIF
jgi:exodeoxyribonuclease-3